MLSPIAWFLLPSLAIACTTLVATRGSTTDGSVMLSHSNDGDGATVGNLRVEDAATWVLPQRRKVSRGSVPQVATTFSYFSKVDGYASINEHQVALAESTCVAVFANNGSAGAALNIVDLSELGLERAASARAAVLVMGNLAEQYGYYDNGESLLVGDPQEAFIFHVLPDHTGTGAVWVAQRVPDGHVGVVANSFTVREVALDDSHAFLHSANLLQAAAFTGRWSEGPLDFTFVFAGPEPGRKYTSGRRMWRAFQLLAPDASAHLPVEYVEYVSGRPYPATLPAANVSRATMRSVMRDFYEGTAFDMSHGMAAGAFGSPARGSVAAGTVGGWERPIAIGRTIVSYVAVCRAWLPSAVGGVLWFSMHAAHTSVYVPFFAGMTTPAAHPVALPDAYTSNRLGSVDRTVGAWQAARFVFNAAQLNFQRALPSIRLAQRLWEQRGETLVDDGTAAYVAGALNMEGLARRCHEHAVEAVGAWWTLSDELQLAYSHPSEVYPDWWLQAVNYSGGPSPAPPVPPTSQPDGAEGLKRSLR